MYRIMEKTNLLVVGDTILDQYAGCEAIGMSAEAPVLVVRELQKRIMWGCINSGFSYKGIGC